MPDRTVPDNSETTAYNLTAAALAYALEAFARVKGPSGIAATRYELDVAARAHIAALEKADA